MLREFYDVILKRIERALYDKWSSGELASVVLQQLFALLMDKLMKTMDVIEEAMCEESSHLEAYLKDKQDNVYAWDNLNVLHRLLGTGAKLYTKHQTILAHLYTSKTKMMAYEFAQKLLIALLTGLTQF